MAEDLSQWLDYAADGTPRLKPGVRSLPPMKPRPVAGRAATNGSGRAASGAGKDSTSGRATSTKRDEPKRKAADRFGTLNGFVDCSIAGLSRVELATWLILYRDTRNGTACTAQSDIARRAGASVRAVKYAVGRLISCGLLVRIHSGGLNRGPSRYRVEPLQRNTASKERDTS